MKRNQGKNDFRIDNVVRWRGSTHIIAYKVHPRDQISVLSSISAWLGQSHNSGARKGAEQCSAAHSYVPTINKLKHIIILILGGEDLHPILNCYNYLQTQTLHNTKFLQ